MAEPKRPWPKHPSPKRPSPKRPWPKRPTFELCPSPLHTISISIAIGDGTETRSNFCLYFAVIIYMSASTRHATTIGVLFLVYNMYFVYIS